MTSSIGRNHERNEPPSRWLKSTEWLAGQLGKNDVVIVDGSYYLPTQKRDAKAEYFAAHIPGAVFFDINAVADNSTDLPHMLPGPDQFGEAAGALGITEKDTIVVYDGSGFSSAPRVWWTFRIFGARNVFILDGGLPAWKQEGRPTEAGEVKRAKRTFNASMDTGAVAMVSDVQMALNNESAQVVDARSAGRFAGTEPEPRPGLRSGHMPGAFNVPSTEIVENGRLASPDKIAAAFKKARRRYRQADHHHLRLRRHCRYPSQWDSMPRQDNCRASMTAPGRNGARVLIWRSRKTKRGAVSAKSGSGTAWCARAADGRRIPPAHWPRRSGPHP